MFEIFAVSVAFLGSAIAGIFDLFTTEVPDEVPAAMLALGIFNWYLYASIIGEATPLILSLTVGTLLLVVGLLLYRAGHWGGADAWLLAAIGYAVPLYNGQLFIPAFIFNFLIVGSAYMVVYAIILGIMNRGVFSYFIQDLSSNQKKIAAAIFLSMIPVLFFYFISRLLISALQIFSLFVLLIFFWRYAKVIENRVFRRRISTRELKVGDVTEDMLWRGITAAEINKLRRSKQHVIIKEGVRFVPVFAITLLVTLLFGNLMFLIL